MRKKFAPLPNNGKVFETFCYWYVFTFDMKIGFVRQGYVGKNTADNFETRGHGVIRYALEVAKARGIIT